MEPHVVQDQSDAFAFLGDPGTYGLAEPVIRIDTHGAAVFLAGPDVYKVKRAVQFAFMDFSTLEKRRRACENEIAVNKANAPDLYLGVVPISRGPVGLRFGDGGAIVEWAVHLRRFDESRTLDRLADRGELNLGIIAKLADIVVNSHERAPVAAAKQTTLSLKSQIDETLESLAASPDVFAAPEVHDLKRQMTGDFERLAPLLVAREAQGFARRCHGDLHLRNIAMVDSAPLLFDAIEFDESLATCDILYDLAFLLMDLWIRGLKGHANLLFNRYFARSGETDADIEGLAAFPLFLSLRAAIRAKVANLVPQKTKAAIALAQRNFAAARLFFEASPLELVAVGGLSGTGKSSLARAIALLIGRPPGALHLRSDMERKRLFKLGEFDRLPDAAYSPEASAATYSRLRHVAAVALAAGQSALIDAVHLKEDERLASAEVAHKFGARFTGFWLEAPIKTLVERVAARSNDASDATPAVVEFQAKASPGAVAWRHLDASAPLDSLAEQARAALQL